ncbi:MAG TPA: CapA family protein [Actinomycetota bacterium]|nr:CapA family protein [Actinomycetota bacterium]
MRRSLLARFVAVLAVAALPAGSGVAAGARRPATPAPAAAPVAGAPARPTTSQPAAAPLSFTIEATGDMLVHSPVWQRARSYGATNGMAYDFGPMLAKIKPLISAADLAICHIETPMSPDDAHLSGYPLFNSPHELATAIADAGYDGCSTASNHSVDQGAAGVNATLVALDRAGLQHAGTARSAAEAAHVELHDVRGVEIAHLSYTYGTNGNTVAAGMPWIVNVTSVPRILADAHQARLAGASFVVVSMHWGSEYQTSPTAEQRSQAAALLASPDVDLILGDHVHVLQPVERIGGKYVIYGLGNVFSNQSPAAGLPVNTQDGAILKIHVTQQGSALVPDTVTFIPTFCQIGPYLVWPVAEALNDPTTPATLRPQLLASWRRTVTAERSLPGHAADATPDTLPAA